MAASNNLLAFLNFLSMLCSVPIVIVGIWLAAKQDNHYIHWLRFPVVLIGLVFLFLSLSGLIGAYYNNQRLLTFYLCFMALLIIGLLIFLIITFKAFRPSGAYSVQGRAYKDYHLSGFSAFLRSYVTDPKSWNSIRKSIDDTNVCQNLNHKYYYPQDFFSAHLSPIQSGCCKPPTLCWYRYISPTQWAPPLNPVSDPDCFNWNNHPHRLCYNCDSCKAGVLEAVRDVWKMADVILIIVLVLLIGVYVIACCALKNAQSENLFGRLQTRWGSTY